MSNSTEHIPPRPHTPEGATLSCPTCGVIDTPLIGPGTSLHAYRATCRHCAGFIKWLSRFPEPERQARQQAARSEAMARKPPSQPQLDYLTALGDLGPPPATMLEASQRIDHIRRKGRP